MSLLAGIHHLGRYSRVKIFFQIKVKTNTEVVICRKFKQTNKKKPVFKMKITDLIVLLIAYPKL